MSRQHSFVENEQFLAEIYPIEGLFSTSKALHDGLDSTITPKIRRRCGLRTPTLPRLPSRPSPLTLPPMPPDPPAHVPVPYPMYKCLGGYPTTKVFQSPTLPRKQPTVRRKLRKNPKAAITEKESMTVLGMFHYFLKTTSLLTLDILNRPNQNTFLKEK